MNERIKELAEQAEVWNADGDKCEVDLQKFAELIVKECADRCEMSPYPHPNYSVAIKKHLGVEE